MTKPENKARKKIDDLLERSGWLVQDFEEANLSAGRGIAVRNVPLLKGYGEADYLLFVDGKAPASLKRKKKGSR